MNRDPKLIKHIIERFHAKRFPARVKRGFYIWLISPEEYSAKDEAMNGLWNSITVGVGRSVYRSLDAVKAKLGMMPAKRGSVPLRRTAARIAAVMLPAALLAGAYFIYDAAADTPQWASLDVPYGETGAVELDDGTVVRLNAGSTLEYPLKFRGKLRKVRLEGEGFFDVAPNRRKPFVVVSDHMRTTVVGTEFNVCSYDNQMHESVTVLSGEVVVAAGGDTYDLMPDQHLTYWIDEGRTDIEECDAASMIGWLGSGLVFENSTLEDILCGLQRAYDLRIMVDARQLDNTIYCLKFVNGEPLDYVLDVVHSLVGLPYRLEGGTLTVGSDTEHAAELAGNRVSPPHEEQQRDRP